MNTTLTIRPERGYEHHYVEHLTREAFWDVYHPGCTEHLILHQLRKSQGFIPELNLVALMDDWLVGHAIATKASIVDQYGNRNEVLCLGPLSVLPEKQNRGIGGTLLGAIEAAARGLGYKAIILIGHPAYYRRFGYRSTAPWHITMPGGATMDEMMLLELHPGALDGIEGEFHPDPGFDTTEGDVEQFDSRFPKREKHITDTQLK